VSGRLIIFAGLPGVGKSAIARELARRRKAVYVRVDTIEQPLLDAAVLTRGDLGYIIAYGLAAENLRLGLEVISDTVNPIALTREAWRKVAVDAGAVSVEVEIVCSDPVEHRRRVETRTPDITGHAPPTWREVETREYHAWTRDRIVIDTAGRDLASCVAELEACLQTS
jgi:predicted kinase